MVETIAAVVGALAAVAAIVIGPFRWLKRWWLYRSDDSQDGPVRFLVNKGLPMQLHNQDYCEFSIVNVGAKPLAVRAFTVHVRAASCIDQARTEGLRFLEGTVCDLIQRGGDTIRTLEVGMSLDYRLSFAEVIGLLDMPDGDPMGISIGFAMGCAVVDEKRDRFGYPGNSISYRYLASRSAGTH